MAYTESKAYDLRNVQYKGTRIGGTDQITTSPIQYKGTPVPYVKYKNYNIMHRYTVWNGNDYDDEFTFDGDYYDEELAGSYSVSSTTKMGDVYTDVPAPEPYSNRTINCEYDITKYELTRTSGTKNESKYYLYAFTIMLRADNGSDTERFRIDKYDYLSTEDISLDTLAAQIEDPSGGTEGFTPPWNLDIPTETILENTRRERYRTDEVEYIGNFNNFTNIDDIEEGEPSSWGDEFDYEYYNGIFNQGAEGLTVNYYVNSSSSQQKTIGDGNSFNFGNVVNSKSELDDYHVYISGCNYTSNHSSCTVDNYIDDRHPVCVIDDFNELRSSNDFSRFSLIFLLSSSCSNYALGNGSDKMVLTYYREDATIVAANVSYDNGIMYRDY